MDLNKARNINLFRSAFTVDVEDGINIAMRDSFGIEIPPTNRVLENVQVILDLLETSQVRATFFILGEVAETFPDLTKKIGSYGHEIGVHGYHHDQVFNLTPQMFRNELLRAKNLIEYQVGQKVIGFRAPAFSINYQTSWAFNTLVECGFEYDSSVFPSISGRYGWKGFPKDICKINLKNSCSIIEVPLPVIKVFGKNFPVCGGGYLRYFPYAFTRYAFRSLNKERPVVVYMHPYELDKKKYPDYFYEARSRADFMHNIFLHFYRFKKGSVRNKLAQILRESNFFPVKEIIADLETRKLLSSINLD